ncbi:MAG: DUF4126 domain-containing protein [Anaerolineae bacterium]|nr:DUF4126 domain-containing protein [Anaerolineae bacterium]
MFTSFGLSTSAGLNAYLPLLIVGLLSRFTNLIRLNEPFDALESWWTIGVLVVLATIEILADKIPVVDSINDVIQTFIRPIAGAILFAANANAIADIHPVLAMICGLLIAGTVHVAKAVARPIVTVATAGAGDPVVSTAEDIVSALTALLSVLLPVLMGVVLLVAVLIIGWWLWARERQRRAGRHGSV